LGCAEEDCEEQGQGRGSAINKLIVSFMLFFLLGTILSGIAEGGGGIATTKLVSDHSAVVTTLTVSNTEGFLKSNYVLMGNEKVRYTNKTATTFTGCTRGYDGTEAVAHSANDRVYSPDSGVLNSALGFNIAATGATIGVIGVPMVAFSFVSITLPRIILWNYSWLKEGWLAYLRIVLQFISVGFLVYMCYQIATAMGQVIGRIWGR